MVSIPFFNVLSARNKTFKFNISHVLQKFKMAARDPCYPKWHVFMVFQINNISFSDNTHIPTSVHSELLGNVFFNATQYLMSRKGIYGTNAI